MTVNDAEFLRAFEAAALPDDAFHHRDHVRAAWLLLRRERPVAALDRFSAAVKRLAAAKGRPGVYHETITWAYLLLINERMERGGRDVEWDDFAAENPDLLAWRPSILDGYYDPETLGSELARRVFVLPDRRAGEDVGERPDRQRRATLRLVVDEHGDR